MCVCAVLRLSFYDDIKTVISLVLLVSTVKQHVQIKEINKSINQSINERLHDRHLEYDVDGKLIHRRSADVLSN